MTAIRVVAGGDALLAPSITRRLIEEFARRPAASARPEALAALSPRELEVLRLVARGLSNTEIAGELFLGDATVKTHVSRILQKLALRDRVQAVVVAYESGLLQPGAEGRPLRPSLTSLRESITELKGSAFALSPLTFSWATRCAEPRHSP